MISLTAVSRIYQSTDVAGQGVIALDQVDLRIERGEFVAITGPSGCGKSTLMHLIGGLDTPTSGELIVDGLALHAAGEKELTAYRRHRLGVVFQFFNLLPTMTVRENVTLPLMLQGVRAAEAGERAEEKIALVGMGHRAGHFPHQLSGGEMQRTAIARALVHGPSVLLADEPTGNLDSANTRQVLDILREIHGRGLATLLVVTHSEEVAEIAPRRISMRDGRVESDRRSNEV